MKLVQQRAELDCGIACAAMILDRPYGVVEGLVPHGVGQTRGMNVREMQAILARCQGTQWESHIPGRKEPLAQQGHRVAHVTGTVLMVLGHPRERYRAHWVVYEDGFVYDPEHARPRSLSVYPRRHWKLLRIVAPYDRYRPLRAKRRTAH